MALRVRKATRALTQAANTNSTFHLWFHPFNIATDPNGLLDGLESIFKEVVKLRDKGLLTNPTMGEFTEYLDTAVYAGKAVA